MTAGPALPGDPRPTLTRRRLGFFFALLGATVPSGKCASMAWADDPDYYRSRAEAARDSG
jgi:hypothetical protein